MSILQLLPLNEVGSDFSPYNSISTFALEPMYLRLENLRIKNKKKYHHEIKKLKEKFPTGKGRVNYGIKRAKLELLYGIYKHHHFSKSIKYNRFVKDNDYWLKDYALYKFIKDHKNEKAWDKWQKTLKNRDEETLKKLENQNKTKITFYYWLQWQLYEQMSDVKEYAKDNGVLIMGDIPFLVSRDSADTWSHQAFFKMDYEAGAPPDYFFSKGQRWGMPPYDWNNIVKDGFNYIGERLRFAENFYDMFRIDHFIGLLRVWVISKDSPKKRGAKDGKFDPELEYLWGEHGRKLIAMMMEVTDMLPCAEDLGTVPPASYKLLWKNGIPGIEVQRWTKHWDNTFSFIRPDQYRINSVATVSTHDSSTLPVWWKYEAGTIDVSSFNKFCRKHKISSGKIKNKLFDKDHPGKDKLYWKKDIDSLEVLEKVSKLKNEALMEITGMYVSSFAEKEKFWKYIGFYGKMREYPDEEFIEKTMRTINNTASIFSIQLINEYLYLDKKILKDHSSRDDRINSPGLVNDRNWTLQIPLSLEKLKKHPVNNMIKEIMKESERK